MPTFQIPGEDVLATRMNIVKQLLSETTPHKMVVDDESLSTLNGVELKVSFLEMLSKYQNALRTPSVSGTELNFRIYDLCLRARRLEEEYKAYRDRQDNNKVFCPFHVWIRIDAIERVEPEMRLGVSKKKLLKDPTVVTTVRNRIIDFVVKHSTDALVCEEAIKLNKLPALSERNFAQLDSALCDNKAIIAERLEKARASIRSDHGKEQAPSQDQGQGQATTAGAKK
ncbi:hypothetical protein BC940DRAFT_363867 [Gongronella butleri]|nr:hypothetical protein BC940DRAFT_363867 [Gongronella butleri]